MGLRQSGGCSVRSSATRTRIHERVAAFAEGVLPFFEPELAELLNRHTATGRLRFTTLVAQLAESADVHFICVGTPQRVDQLTANTRHVETAVMTLVPHLTRRSLIVGKSTVPVGTASRLNDLAQQYAAPGVAVEVAWNPEFLREGHAVQDTLEPSRIVVGVASPEAEKVLRHIYRALILDETPVVVTDLATAELVKAAANAFLATKISFANVMADLCDAAGADVVTLADASGWTSASGAPSSVRGSGSEAAAFPRTSGR